MCHCIADTHEELIAMMNIIGVNPKWIQYRGTSHEHFDISKKKRAEAIKHGAIAISSKELVRKLRSRRTAGPAISRTGEE